MKALAVAPDGNLFVGGFFNAVNGDTTVKKLVKLNPTTGQRITAFSANTNGQVWDIKVSGSRLLVGGRFTTIKNVARDRLAAVDVTTGAVDANVNFTITEPHTSDSITVGLQHRREPRRFGPRDHRQLHEGQRVAPPAGRSARPVHEARQPRELADRPVHPTVQLPTRSTPTCATSTSPRTGPTS